MPIYEYKCNDCGAISDILVRSLSSMSIACTKCQSGNMTKLISVPGAVMTKGGGGACDESFACPQKHQCSSPHCCRDH